MPKTRRIILFVVNFLAISIALLLVFYFLHLRGRLLAVSTRFVATHEQAVAKINSVSDPARLHSFIARDDEYIRAQEGIITSGAGIASSIFVLFGVLAGLNLVLLSLPFSSRDSTAKEVL